MKGYMYILKCADDSYYTGSTNNLENRIIEAAKLGFKKIICPAIKSRENLPDIEIVPIKNIAQLLRVAF